MGDEFELLRTMNVMRNPMPKDPVNRANVEHVLRHGYVVIRNCFTKQEADEAKAETDRLGGPFPMGGRNDFEGFKTHRIYSLLNKTRVFDKFTVLPRVLALNDFFLDVGYNITAFHTIQINPGETRQEMHHDDQYCYIPRPRLPLTTTIIAAFDDFTAENGATCMIPGSHTWGRDRQGKYEETVPMICPAGSVVFHLGTTWHCGGDNKSPNPRYSATVSYCQPYLRPFENQILAVDPRKLKDIPPRIVEMMGYRIHQPFIGSADGLDPIKASQRMVKWLQGPVDYSPSTFSFSAHGESRL